MRSEHEIFSEIGARLDAAQADIDAARALLNYLMEARTVGISKRGPVQGVGRRADELLLQSAGGMRDRARKDVLRRILKEFPTAKTTLNCIVWYENKLKREGRWPSSQ
jgi:hypothetical protein